MENWEHGVLVKESTLDEGSGTELLAWGMFQREKEKGMQRGVGKQVNLADLSLRE